MTSKDVAEAFVWFWLPGRTEPVVAGRVSAQGETLQFNYGRSYLERDDAIAIYLPELPLEQGLLPLPNGLSMPSSLRDAAPDAWGRRVILNRTFGAKGREIDSQDLSELVFLLESGSDRIGALDFQASATEYIPRQHKNATLEELMESAARVEAGIPLTPELDQALHHGSSIGGARPKALIESDEKKFIAKFSASNDVYSVVKAEFIAMRLGALTGLTVAPVSMVQASGKDVMLIERFDRIKAKVGWRRKSMVSALTLFGLDEMMARYASYEQLCEIIRHRFENPKATLQELYARLVFNILCGNTDDHARNHAAFWDGQNLQLTPAYDICPQARSGREASQAMLIHSDQRMSRLQTALEAARHFLIKEKDAIQIIEKQISVIAQNWEDVCKEASLSEVDKSLFWGRQFLNPFAFEGLEGEAGCLATLHGEIIGRS
ncbi:MAG: HipA domain-containing protein [Pseudomonadota bacterium]